MPNRPSPWQIALAFLLVYLTWGTTFIAIKKGVENLPPGLFGGVRVTCAGLALLGYLALRGQAVTMSRSDFNWTFVVGFFMFVGGNGLLSFAVQSVESGVASILAATSPFFVALLEMLWSRGERLNASGWAGLAIGFAGVLLLLAPRLQTPWSLTANPGPLMILGSALSWAFGTFILRHKRFNVVHLPAAAFQMILGGGTMTVIGLLMGEHAGLCREHFTPQAVYAFFHLLIAGSLIGFVSYTWLLRHVSAASAGTYAYVNPAIALLAGWLINDEPITSWIVSGMAVILVGVALVRKGTSHGLNVATSRTAGATAPPEEAAAERGLGGTV